MIASQNIFNKMQKREIFVRFPTILLESAFGKYFPKALGLLTVKRWVTQSLYPLYKTILLAGRASDGVCPRRP